MIQIFVDSGANLSPELREQYNIHLLPMALTIDDQPAPEGLDGHEYYEALRSGADVRTSMVNPDDAKKAFETYLSQGDDVVYFSISAGISGSWWSAKLAGDELMEEYPGRRVCPIDSMGASLGAGIPALKASSLVRQGMGLDELVEKMTVYCQNYCQYFAVDDLKYLRKGGRISGASALVGSLLQIKPILRGNEEGKIVLFDKARGKLRAIERLVSIYKERAIDLDDLIGISHGDQAAGGGPSGSHPAGAPRAGDRRPCGPRYAVAVFPRGGQVKKEHKTSAGRRPAEVFAHIQASVRQTMDKR